MKIIINTSSMVPIYEQIIDQIKTMIRKQELKQNDQLPSVRALSKELKISALTVKKAYDELVKRRLYSNDSWKRQLCDSGEHGVDDGRAKEGSRTGLRTSNSKRKAFWHQ